VRQGYKGFSSFSAFSAEKNRSEAKPGVARPGAQKITRILFNKYFSYF
jgi:hypothetical protein